MMDSHGGVLKNTVLSMILVKDFNCGKPQI